MTKEDNSEVVPFCVADRGLFAEFLADLPRRAIVDLIRHNEQLRNRYFKGFRITQKLPRLDQVAKAFRQEILKRNNFALQEVLFTVWLTTMNDEVVADALLSLGDR